MAKVKQKVLAYITCRQQLLVFSHPDFPEAGIQVPAGTIEEAEQPENAVLREAFEETGLTNLTLDCFLGKQLRDMSDFGRDEWHYRYFYHLYYLGDPPSLWQHEECYPSEGAKQKPHIFELFWVPLPNGVPVLIADHGIMLPQLLERLSCQNM